MSKNITVKINDSIQTIQSVKVNASSKSTVKIQAQNNVCYELVDDVTQFASEQIVTKRAGNDLHIAFDETNVHQIVDLIIEGYYEDESQEVILGLAEDSEYYAYVPESGGRK